MSEPSDMLHLRPCFALSAEHDDYSASLLDAVSEVPVITIRLPRRVVERAVLEAVGVSLELRTNGTVAVYAEASDLDTVTATSLLLLVRDAVELLGTKEIAEELTYLEAALAQALSVVRERLRGSGDGA